MGNRAAAGANLPVMTILAATANEDVKARLVQSLAARPDCHLICVNSLGEICVRLGLYDIHLVIAGPDVSTNTAPEVLRLIADHCSVLLIDRGNQVGAASDIGLPKSHEAIREVVSGALRARRCGQGFAHDGEQDEDELTNPISIELELTNDQSQASKTAGLLVRQVERLGWFDRLEGVHTSIALEEALLNAIIHGNLEVSSTLRERDDDEYARVIVARRADPRYDRRHVRVLMEADLLRARWIIRDEGPGFDVSNLPDPRQSDRITLASGRGVLLMRSFMDGVTYNARGNQVEMVKYNHAARSGSFAREALLPTPA
jgi:anti-sigma regulatory factor (Ser/Thr protein kinase)